MKDFVQNIIGYTEFKGHSLDEIQRNPESPEYYE